MYFIYILRCADSSLYCGYTSDMKHRIKAHTGKIAGGAKYTRSRRPIRVERVWKTESREGVFEWHRDDPVSLGVNGGLPLGVSHHQVEVIAGDVVF